MPKMSHSQLTALNEKYNSVIFPIVSNFISNPPHNPLIRHRQLTEISHELDSFIDEVDKAAFDTNGNPNEADRPLIKNLVKGVQSLYDSAESICSRHDLALSETEKAVWKQDEVFRCTVEPNVRQLLAGTSRATQAEFERWVQTLQETAKDLEEIQVYPSLGNYVEMLGVRSLLKAEVDKLLRELNGLFATSGNSRSPMSTELHATTIAYPQLPNPPQSPQPTCAQSSSSRRRGKFDWIQDLVSKIPLDPLTHYTRKQPPPTIFTKAGPPTATPPTPTSPLFQPPRHSPTYIGQNTAPSAAHIPIPVLQSTLSTEPKASAVAAPLQQFATEYQKMFQPSWQPLYDCPSYEDQSRGCYAEKTGENAEWGLVDGPVRTDFPRPKYYFT
jgi:hypothetical protein